MSPRQTTLGWIVWAVAAIGAIWFFLHEASGQTKGDGARALLRGIKQPGMPALPKLVAPPVRTFFYAATATGTNGMTSVYSNEVSSTNLTVLLAWNPSAGAISNYTVLRGTNSGAYLKSYPAGTNLILQVPPPPPSNLVITVSGSTNFSLTNPPAPMMLFTGKNLTITRRYF
jgi:hypothetical protein